MRKPAKLWLILKPNYYISWWINVMTIPGLVIPVTFIFNPEVYMCYYCSSWVMLEIKFPDVQILDTIKPSLVLTLALHWFFSCASMYYFWMSAFAPVENRAYTIYPHKPSEFRMSFSIPPYRSVSSKPQFSSHITLAIPSKILAEFCKLTISAFWRVENHSCLDSIDQ